MNDETLADTLAKAAWEAYKKANGEKSFNGDPLPTWEDMVHDAEPRRKLAVSAWRLASLAVVEELLRLLETHQLSLRHRPTASDTRAGPFSTSRGQ